MVRLGTASEIYCGCIVYSYERIKLRWVIVLQNRPEAIVLFGFGVLWRCGLPTFVAAGKSQTNSEIPQLRYVLELVAGSPPV